MKKYILVLAIGVTSFGTFAQGLGDIKKASKEVDVEAAKAVVTETTTEVATGKVEELTGKVTDAVNVDQAKIDEVKAMATDAVENGTVDNVTEMATDKMDDIKAEKVEAVNVEAYSVDELKTQAADTEVLKDEKKANLLTKITDLATKITTAESKLAMLKESGASADVITEKAAVIAGAKEKLASLTSSFN